MWLALHHWDRFFRMVLGRPLNDIKQPISLPFGLRCFYIAQLGKYVPGKGLALFLRINSAMKENVTITAGVVTSIYEVLLRWRLGRHWR